MHLESTKLWVDEFVRAVLPHGTTVVAADPHEIANVFGIPGVAALIAAAAPLPFTFGVCASSCVPASPFESSGADLSHVDVGSLIDDHGAIGVAEVMNFPGVIAGDPKKRWPYRHRRLEACRRACPRPIGVWARRVSQRRGRIGPRMHDAGRGGREATQRHVGVHPEGSASRNLVELIPMVLSGGTDLLAFCTDDREPDTLRSAGHVNDCARMAVANGVREVDLLVMASTNPAMYHGFNHLGHLAPGYQADILAFAELSTWQPSTVWQGVRRGPRRRVGFERRTR